METGIQWKTFNRKPRILQPCDLNGRAAYGQASPIWCVCVGFVLLLLRCAGEREWDALQNEMSKQNKIRVYNIKQAIRFLCEPVFLVMRTQV